MPQIILIAKQKMKTSFNEHFYNLQQISSNKTLCEWAIPCLIFIYFLVFSTNSTFLQQYNVKRYPSR